MQPEVVRETALEFRSRAPDLLARDPAMAKVVAARLREQRELALMFRQLTTIECNAPLDYAMPAAPRGEPDPEMLEGLATTLRFGPMTRRRLRMAAGLEEPAPGGWQPVAPA